MIDADPVGEPFTRMVRAARVLERYVADRGGRLHIGRLIYLVDRRGLVVEQEVPEQEVDWSAVAAEAVARCDRELEVLRADRERKDRRWATRSSR